jgi:hypothetical protein
MHLTHSDSITEAEVKEIISPATMLLFEILQEITNL